MYCETERNLSACLGWGTLQPQEIPDDHSPQLPLLVFLRSFNFENLAIWDISVLSDSYMHLTTLTRFDFISYLTPGNSESFILSMIWWIWGFPGGSDSKKSACNAGYLDLIHGLGRSPGEENGYPLQYSFLEDSMDRGAWRAAVHGVAKSQTWLSD